MKHTTVYLAGPIKGNPANYKLMFEEAEFRLNGPGEIVLNPARLLEGMEDRDCLPICLQMVELADHVVLLPGWEKSLGATTEALYALRQGKDVFAWDMRNRSIKEMGWDPERGIVCVGG